MSVKTFIQILIIILIFSILGSVYFKYFNINQSVIQENENLEYVAETNSALIGSFESIGKSNFIVGALANAKEGDIIGPLPTLRGQAFLKVIDIADVVMSDFEEKKDSIKFSLLIDRQNAIWGNWLQALRDNADLKDYRYDFY